MRDEGDNEEHHPYRQEARISRAATKHRQHRGDYTNEPCESEADHRNIFCAILFSLAVCRCAGVPTPLTARLLALIHTVERGERPQSLVTLDALAVHAPV